MAKEPEKNDQNPNAWTIIRVVIVTIVAVLTTSYTIGVLSGEIPKEHQIDLVHLGLIAFATLIIILVVRPKSLSRIRLLEMAGFRLEMLERVKERQAEQEQLIEDINLILPLLLPETEQKHLFNLDRGKAEKYKSSSALRAELRRLRSIDLIRMKDGKHVGDMKSGMEFDLSDFVELTKNGERWLRRIRQIEDKEEGN